MGTHTAMDHLAEIQDQLEAHETRYTELWAAFRKTIDEIRAGRRLIDRLSECNERNG